MVNRVPINRTVKPQTKTLLAKLATRLELSQGQTLDRAVKALEYALLGVETKPVDTEKLHKLAASTLEGLTDEEKREVTKPFMRPQREKGKR